MNRAAWRGGAVACAAGLMIVVGHGVASAQKPRDVLVEFVLPERTSTDAIVVDPDPATPYKTNKTSAVWAEIRSGQNAFLTLGTHRTDSSRRFCVRLPTDGGSVNEVCSGDGQIHTGNGDSMLAMQPYEVVDKPFRVHWHDPATDEGYFLSWGADLDGNGGADTPPVSVTCVTAGTRCSEWQIEPKGNAHLYRESSGRIGTYSLTFTITVRTAQ